jgi:hypothetical protein
MNIFSNFVPIERFEKGLAELSHIDFSLFNDYRPNPNELSLSPINIFIAGEPDHYFGNHSWVIDNKDNFSVILSWGDEILNNCDNSYFCPYGESWWFDNPYEYDSSILKRPITSFLRGSKLIAVGHHIRHEIFGRQSEIKTPIQFWPVLGTLDTYENVRDSKMESFRDYMFSLCIENAQSKNYFTEKITDCILNKTIPIYWGCPNIADFYDTRGIICFNTADEAIDIMNNLTEKDYIDRMEYIEANYKKAFEYKDYIKTIKNKITEIFEHNKLL